MNNKNYKYLLFDLDDTILSFKKGEDYAITELFKFYGIDASETNKQLYSDINLSYWKKHEKQEVTTDYLIVQRFIDLFEILKPTMNLDKLDKANDYYFEYLTSVAYLIDGSIDVLKALKEKYKLYIITNGVKRVQDDRIKLVPILYELTEKIYISEEVGYTKPQKEFADRILKDINAINDECLIIGDSLTSDMKLGVNSNIDTVWFNENHNKDSVDFVTYEINDIHDLLGLLL